MCVVCVCKGVCVCMFVCVRDTGIHRGGEMSVLLSVHLSGGRVAGQKALGKEARDGGGKALLLVL